MLNNDLNPTTLSRLELLKLAQTLHVSDADVMTRAELRAAIERARRTESRPAPQPVTWLGVARRLLASIVEQGLHLPDAAAVIRGDASGRSFPGGPPPVATVTLARIYAAQGHLERGIHTLDEVLKSDPDHDLARDLRAQLSSSLEERRRQEREQQQGSAATAAHAENELGAALAEESSPASDLLDAVPNTDDITLSGGAVDEPPNATPEAEPETQRTSSAPAALLEVAPPEPDAATPPVVVAVPEAPPVIAAAPEAPPVIAAAPEAPPVIAAVPEAPPVVVAAPEASASAAALEPRSAGLVLLETKEPSTYLYWELASPAPAVNGEPHWVCLVAHTAHGAGSKRRELRFAIFRPSGALRIEGLPPHSIVRAKLSCGETAEAPPLVVAGAVWASDAPALEQAGPYPAALAARATSHLASAVPVYY